MEIIVKALNVLDLLSGIQGIINRIELAAN
jgi:hypothetical protein